MTERRVLRVMMLAGLLAACSSGSAPVVAPPTASPVAPSTSAPAPSTPTASASPSPSALSPFEDDPAVKALRVQYVGLAKAVNAKTIRVPEMLRTSTSLRLKEAEKLMRPEYGDRYPGPIPFTPVAVTHVSSTQTKIVICVLADGWLRDATSGEPTLPRRLERGTFTMRRVDGVWKADVSRLLKGSCTDVPIPEVYFR